MVMLQPQPAGLPKYRQVANVLRERIRSGAFAPGAALPSEVELEKEFGFHRGTLRQAIAVLRREGLLDVIHGKGTFVRQRRLIRRDIAAGLRYEHAHIGTEVPAKDLFAALTETAGQIDVPTTYQTVAAGEDLAEAFGIEVGAMLLCRRYLFLVDGAPHQVVDSYLRADMVQDTPIADPANERPNRGTMAQLAEIGVKVDHVDLDVQSRQATAEEAAQLAIAEGVPVFAFRRVMRCGELPVEVCNSVAPGDVLVLRMSIDLGSNQ
jgi:GntR family transcriptional regulator